jgi:hypothetical protein
MGSAGTRGTAAEEAAHRPRRHAERARAAAGGTLGGGLIWYLNVHADGGDPPTGSGWTRAATW